MVDIYEYEKHNYTCTFAFTRISRDKWVCILFHSEAPSTDLASNDTQPISTVFYNTQVSLDCSEAKGYPPPNYYWFFVNSSGNGESSMEPIAFLGPVLTINTTIASMWTNGSLHYLCNVSNEFGSAGVHFFLAVMPTPTLSSLQAMSPAFSSAAPINSTLAYDSQVASNNVGITKNGYAVNSVKGTVFSSPALQHSPSNNMVITTSNSSFDLFTILQLAGLCVVAALVLVLIVVVVTVFSCWYSHRRTLNEKERSDLTNNIIENFANNIPVY